MTTVTLDEIIESLPIGGSVPEALKQDALSRALIPDASGLLPGTAGYQATYDVYYAALLLMPVMSHPSVTQVSSEGTTIHVSSVDWDSIRDYLQSMSIIARSSKDILQVIPIEATSGARVCHGCQ